MLKINKLFFYRSLAAFKRAGLFPEKFSIFIKEQFFVGFIFVDTYIKGDNPFGVHFENFVNGIPCEIL